MGWPLLHHQGCWATIVFTQKPTQEVVGAAMSSYELPQGRHLLCKS